VGNIDDCIREIAEVWAQRFQEKAIAFYFLPNDKLAALSLRLLQECSTWSPTCSITLIKYTPASGNGVAARRAVLSGKGEP
jgi:hypothetical protein